MLVFTYEIIMYFDVLSQNYSVGAETYATTFTKKLEIPLRQENELQ